MGELVAFSGSGNRHKVPPVHCTVDLSIQDGKVSIRIYGADRERANLAAIACALESAAQQIKEGES